MTDRPSLVRVVRSGLQESEHFVHVAICDADGRLLASAGDPGRLVFARSSMKPLQAAVSLSAIGHGPSERHLAVMCASHNGEPVHVRTVRALLRRAGLDDSALRNPPGWPLDPEAMARSRERSRVRHNCSGKHAGMLVACEAAGWDRATYLRRRHPLQRRVLRAVLAGTGLSEVRIGVDGCGVPVHGLPLASMAVLFARLARPDRFGGLASEAARTIAAMRAHPYLVAGRKREDTAIMQSAPGVVVKSGAEGLICAAVIEPGIGVAVKVADGGDRAAAPALLHVLQTLGHLPPGAPASLDRFARPWVMGGGERVGEVEVDVAIRRSR